MSQIQTSSMVEKTFKKTKVAGQLNLAVFGDVHLGHHRTTTDEIIEGLYGFFPRNKETKELDIIVIEGDLFDRLLFLNDVHRPLIIEWMAKLLKMCAEYDIKLRVLEGTPSHDCRQSKLFVDVNGEFNIGADLKYIDDLSIEMMDDLGISVLYLPDEWDISLQKCYDSALKKMLEYGLDKVDFVIMHGAFDYQFPPNLGIETHNSRDWCSIVNYHIFVGHVHQYSQYDKILAAGSVDRLSHGDEKPKGHLRVSVKPNGESQIKFIVNPLAKIYLTIDCVGLSVEQSIEKIRTIIEGKPKGSYFRILSTMGSNISVALEWLKAEFPDYYWDTKVELAPEDKPSDNIVLAVDKFVPIDINAGNIVKLVMDRIDDSVSPEMKERCKALLEEVL